MRNHRCGRDSLLDPSFNRTSLYRTCMCVCVCVYTLAHEVESGPRYEKGTLCHSLATHQHLRSTDLIIVSLYLSRTLSRKQKRGGSMLCKVARVCTCEPVAVWCCNVHARGDEVSRGGNARETPAELRREQWRIHRGAKSSADDNTASLFSGKVLEKKKKKKEVLTRLGNNFYRCDSFVFISLLFSFFLSCFF